jgi:hypothetical protein
MQYSTKRVKETRHTKIVDGNVRSPWLKAKLDQNQNKTISIM